MSEQAVMGIAEVLSELATHPCWSAKRGHGTFLTFELGGRQQIDSKRGSKEIGTYHLWVYLARWTLRCGGAEAGWDSSNDEVDQLLKKFEGESIVSIETHPVVIRFSGSVELGVSLAPQDDAESGDELFRLYLPGHRVVSAFPDGTLKMKDGRLP